MRDQTDGMNVDNTCSSGVIDTETKIEKPTTLDFLQNLAIEFTSHKIIRIHEGSTCIRIWVVRKTGSNPNLMNRYRDVKTSSTVDYGQNYFTHLYRALKGCKTSSVNRTARLRGLS